MRIIVADDDPTSREMLAFLLEDLGHEVLAAADGAEAWEAFQAAPTRVVLTDWAMPVVDGLELTRRIRTAATPHYVHVLMVTTHADEGHVVEGFGHGVDDYVTKPYGALELRARIGTIERMVALEDQLQAANAAKDRLLGVVAHDLANPLFAILGSAELILHTSRDLRAEDRAGLEVIVRSARRMGNLSRDLVDVAAVARGKVALERSSCALDAIVRDAAHTLSYTAAAKRTTIEADVPEATAWCDPDRVQSVLENLLSNAIKYSPSGSTIRVELADAGGEQVVSVIDQGPGLTAEDRERMFGTFERLSARPTGRERSTGLGLAIVQRLVTAHGGRVWVEPEPEAGSRFRFTLPSGPPSA